LKEIDPSVKVLLSSGYGIDGQATEMLNDGCEGFIQKPFDLTRLSHNLREILDGKKPPYPLPNASQQRVGLQ
jgi:DNA-binding NtrC family response regulator